MIFVGTIGIEIHLQLNTQTKLFCGCANSYSQDPNAHICEICLGHPGTLPRLNRVALEKGIQLVHALGMDVATEIKFDRKHYVYPDLSKNYQTSQFYNTLSKNGLFSILTNGGEKTIQLREAHLEEDAARLVHADKETKIDYNRGGSPLIELVTEPDFSNGAEVEVFLRKFQLLVRTINVSDANMELGQMRCDANVSVKLHSDKVLGIRTELKNINSPKFVKKAIEFEVNRQIKILESGGEIIRETRTWCEKRNITTSLRTKEEYLDYRYLPDPDIPIVHLTEKDINEIIVSCPELPHERILRYESDFNINSTVANELVNKPALADYFDSTIILFNDGHLVSSWLLNQVRALFKKFKYSFEDSPIMPTQFADLLELIHSKKITSKNATMLLEKLAESNMSAFDLANSLNFFQISDKKQIILWINEVIENNPEVVQTALEGETKVPQFLVGQVIKLSNGRASPQIVQEELINVIFSDMRKKYSHTK